MFLDQHLGKFCNNIPDKTQSVTIQCYEYNLCAKLECYIKHLFPYHFTSYQKTMQLEFWKSSPRHQFSKQLGFSDLILSLRVAEWPNRIKNCSFIYQFLLTRKYFFMHILTISSNIWSVLCAQKRWMETALVLNLTLLLYLTLLLNPKSQPIEISLIS